MPTATVNGLRLAREERGSGEPVVLVSGIGVQLIAWPEALLVGAQVVHE